MKVLLVDSDPRSARLIARLLKDEYVIDTVESAERAEFLAYNNHYDIILLELYLPDMDGEDLCSLLKMRLKDVPILVISSKSAVSEKNNVFARGADDFLMKPVSGQELKARMNALLRRYENRSNGYEVRTVKLRDLKLDRDRRMVFYKKERICTRKKEFQLLEFLMINRGRVITRGELLENVWDMNVSLFTNTVDVHIKRLRDKLEKPYGESYLQTVHGVGYICD
jgi:DNA-binding response OmpR family regulator